MMSSYLVWSDADPRRRMVSAKSNLDAASIFLAEPASPTPRTAAEADTPACYVVMMRIPQRLPEISKSFWRALPTGLQTALGETSALAGLAPYTVAIKRAIEPLERGARWQRSWLWRLLAWRRR